MDQTRMMNEAELKTFEDEVISLAYLFCGNRGWVTPWDIFAELAGRGAGRKHTIRAARAFEDLPHELNVHRIRRIILIAGFAALPPERPGARAHYIPPEQNQQGVSEWMGK